jgi:hypothetical protein
MNIAALLVFPLQMAAPSGPHAQPVVHFVVINMSGTARELHHRRDVVPLPIATRVAVQVPAGDRIEIVSAMDTKLKRVITVSATDEGHVVAVR